MLTFYVAVRKTDNNRPGEYLSQTDASGWSKDLGPGNLYHDFDDLKKYAETVMGEVRILKFDLDIGKAEEVEILTAKKGMAGVNPNLTVSKSVSVTDNINPEVRYRHSEEQRMAQEHMAKQMSDDDDDDDDDDAPSNH